MVAYSFKNIRTVPPGKEIIDIVLSKTQRQTPTVIHPGYKISRIRAFYMRKVKYTCETIIDRLGRILEDFPKLDDIHPFYSDLCNVLYDKDHYKLALGQINIAKHLVANVSRDYVRMLKYGDSLYRCKQLKRAAMGRMCTVLKKNAASLSYLEEVRKHLSRLPSIDPNSRTLLVTGFPNVGKSSFMRQVTEAEVDVQPYPFTTKSLFVGHMDYKYLRWQVIDSPGVLDKPLEERSTIEMQAITALAHLQCCVLYFFDISETCGWDLHQQVSLFQSLRPLFSNKPLLIVANKIDHTPLEEMSQEKRAMIEAIARENNAPLLPMSAMNAVGIASVKKNACEALLERRVDQKARSNKVQSIMNRLTVVQPAARDEEQRLPSIPQSVMEERRMQQQAESDTRKSFREKDMAQFQDHEDANEAEQRLVEQAKMATRLRPDGKSAREIMWENGGYGHYQVDLRDHYNLHNQEWKFDTIPEIMDGKNIADFVDADIDRKLQELEQEEERFVSQMDVEDSGSDLDEEEKEAADAIRKAKTKARKISASQKKLNSKKMPKIVTARHKTQEELKEELGGIGFDTSKIRAGLKTGAKRVRAGTDGENSMDVEQKSSSSRVVKRTRHDSAADGEEQDPRQGLRRGEMYKSSKQKELALKKFHKSRLALRHGKKQQLTEADRFTTPKLVKHMVTGKRGIGKTERR